MENIFEEARRATKEALLNEDWSPMDNAFLSLVNKLDFNLIPDSIRVPSPYADKEAVLRQTARQTVFIASLSPVFDLPRAPPLLGGITFYDVAEGLMAAYMFGEFSIRYMPIARKKGTSTTLHRLKKFLEKLGFFKDGGLTGIGQALAKALIYGALKHGTIYIVGFYLSAAVANALMSELSFMEVERHQIMMEAIARYKRIRQAVDDWIKGAPKLYLRDTIIFYGWEDAVKDAIIAKNLAENVEETDFRFTL